jgi:hypothetical protein
MNTDNFCFYLQNTLIQTSQTGGQWYNYTSPLVFLGRERKREGERKRERGREGESSSLTRNKIFNCPELLFLFLKGVTGALAPFSYLHCIIVKQFLLNYGQRIQDKARMF